MQRARRKRKNDVCVSVCPSCGERFPLRPYHDLEAHEKTVFRHVMRCTKPPKHLGKTLALVTKSGKASDTKKAATSRKSLSSEPYCALPASTGFPYCSPAEELPTLLSLGDTSRSQSDSLDSFQSGSSGSSNRYVSNTEKQVSNHSDRAGDGEESSFEGNADCDGLARCVSSSSRTLVVSGKKEAFEPTEAVSTLFLGREGKPSKIAVARKMHEGLMATTKEQSGQAELVDTPIKPRPPTVKRTRNCSRSTNSAPNSHEGGVACPICQKRFSRLGFFDDIEFERSVTSHIVACSAKVATSGSPKHTSGGQRGGNSCVEVQGTKSLHIDGRRRNTDTISQHKSNGRKNARTCSPPMALVVAVKSTGTGRKARTQPTLLERKQTAKTTVSSQQSMESSTIASGTESIGRRANTASKKPTTKKETKGTVVIDPGHFLAQTWWREPIKRERRAIPTKKFDLRQCLIVEQVAPVPAHQSTRGSSRLKKHSRATLKFCCPLCRRVFSEGMLGSLTEEAMGKHVEKCSKRRFDNCDLLLGDKGPEPLFLKSSHEIEQQSVDNSEGRSCEAERVLREEVYAKRVKRMQSIVSARRRSKKRMLAFISRSEP